MCHHQQLTDNEATPNYKKNKIRPVSPPPPPTPFPIGFLHKVHNIKIEKQMHVLPSWETILDHWIQTL